MENLAGTGTEVTEGFGTEPPVISNGGSVLVESVYEDYKNWRIRMNLPKMDDKVAKIPAWKSDGIRLREWAYTCNNPTEEDWKQLMHAPCRFKCGTVEVGEKSGLPHIHAYLYYKNPVVKPCKYFKRADLQPVRDADGWRGYLLKSKTRICGPFQEGEPPHQGLKKELFDLAGQIVQNKMKPKEIALASPGLFAQHHRGLLALSTMFADRERPPPECTWLWGLAGTGKTRYVIDTFGEEHVYIKDCTKWWDNYQGEKAILIDDFDGSWPFRDLLRLLDRYRYQGQTKGGYVPIVSPYIFITCEFHPSAFWPPGNTLDQITRRLHTIREVKKVEETIEEGASPKNALGENEQKGEL